DVFPHACGEERYPEEFGHPKSQHPEWGKLIGAYHRLVDARLGALLARLDPRTVVFVLSDHGMEASPGNLVWPGWHSEEGIFMAAGAPIRRGARVERVDFLDVAPTVLHLLGYPVPRDLKGRVLEEILEPEFLARFPVRSIASYE
ncbi:MAG TPA: alkaline phosphatase family protein, partial [Polyangiaceae bacterium]|nr:alkaline phosphatase family protein [Polyangiaceae bacterium]